MSWGDTDWVLGTRSLHLRLFGPNVGTRGDGHGTRGSPAAVTSPVGGRATVVVAGWVVAIPTAAICSRRRHSSVSHELHPKGVRTEHPWTGECSPSGESCGRTLFRECTFEI